MLFAELGPASLLWHTSHHLHMEHLPSQRSDPLTSFQLLPTLNGQQGFPLQGQGTGEGQERDVAMSSLNSLCRSKSPSQWLGTLESQDHLHPLPQGHHREPTGITRGHVWAKAWSRVFITLTDKCCAFSAYSAFMSSSVPHTPLSTTTAFAFWFDHRYSELGLCCWATAGHISDMISSLLPA